MSNPHPSLPEKHQPTVDPTHQRQALKFLFSPQPHADDLPPKENPLAQETTSAPEIVESLRSKFGEAILNVTEYANEQTIYVRQKLIVEVIDFLKTEHGFVHLSDLGAIDRFTETERFEVFYNIVSITSWKRLRIKVRVEEGDEVPSIIDVHPSSNWHEREVWDMMGIRFSGHPDLRRMFMPEDYEYHPQRKEFPTLGIPGSLPLPPQSTDGGHTLDPFARAHGKIPTD